MTIEKKWYDWTISKQMWDMVRPFIKIIQDEAFGTGEFIYSISDCYSRKCLSMYLTRTQYIKMDIALRRVGDELDALSEVCYKNE